MVTKASLVKRCLSTFLSFTMLIPSVQTTVAAAHSENTALVSAVAAGAETYLLTKDGVAVSDLYIPDIPDKNNEADAYVLSEYQQAIRLVSKAEISKAADLSDSEKLHVVVAFPESLPALSELFPEDLKWIGDSDGFAVRLHEGKFYIFGTSYKGALNGMYDFLEENTGILWTRGDEALGTLYDEQASLSVTKYNYREKSPFALRGWINCGQGSGGSWNGDAPTRRMEGRNKNNIMGMTDGGDLGKTEIGGISSCVNGSVRNGGNPSDFFDKYKTEHPEYFMTNHNGTLKEPFYASNINFYSKEAAEAYAGEIVAYAAKNKKDLLSYGIEDNHHFCMIQDGVNLAEQPFVTDEGKTIQPADARYKSTVAFTFMNRVAKKVKELNPDLKIVYLAYIYTEIPPMINHAEDNIIISMAPIYADDHMPIETSASNVAVKANLEGWTKLTSNVSMYNYYYSCMGATYSRPIAKKVQQDLQYYRSLGVYGLNPEGVLDSADAKSGLLPREQWNMNQLYAWMMYRLMWDPDIDLEAAKKDFCRKAYGAAMDDMLEYYRLIEQGWDTTDGYVWYGSMPDNYILNMIIAQGLDVAILETLDRAYENATGLARDRIAPIRQTMEAQIATYRKFTPEDGKAYPAPASKDELLKPEALNFEKGPWADITPMTVFKDSETMEDPTDEVYKGMEVRALWDEENIYIASRMPLPPIEEGKADPFLPENIVQLNPEDNWWKGSPAYMEVYLAGNRSNRNDYYAFFADPADNQILYTAGSLFLPGTNEDWESHSQLHREAEKPYWAHVLVIPFARLGTTVQDAMPCGVFNFGFNGGWTNYGWCGSGVWSPSSFREIELVGRSQAVTLGDLQFLYDANKERGNDNYAPTSWEAFQLALAETKAFLAQEEPNFEEIGGVYDRLFAAVTALAPYADTEDKIALRELFESCRIKVNIGYSAASWAEFRVTLELSEKALESSTATTVEVNALHKRLETAQNGLDPLAAESELRMLSILCEENRAVVNEGYTEESWTAFQTALSDLELLASSTPTRQELEAAVETLMQARGALKKPAADKSALKALYEANKNRTEKYLTTRSWAAFKDARVEANTVLKDAAASDQAVLEAVTCLETAVANLVYSIPSQVEVPYKAAGEDLFEIRYTPKDTPKGWSYDKNDFLAYISRNPDATYELSFMGTSVDIYATKSFLWGVAGEVWIDGEKVDEYNPYFKPEKGQKNWNPDQLLYSSETLPYGIHTLLVKSAGWKQEGYDTTPIPWNDKGNFALSLSKLVVHNTEAAPEATDDSALRTLYREYQTKQAQYTPETWSAFIPALEAAEVALADWSLTQVELDEAKAALEAAVKELVEKTLHTVSASCGANGTVTPLGETQVPNGDSLTISIRPATGYRVAVLLADGEIIEPNGYYSYTFENVQKGHILVASFERDLQAPSIPADSPEKLEEAIANLPNLQEGDLVTDPAEILVVEEIAKALQELPLEERMALSPETVRKMDALLRQTQGADINLTVESSSFGADALKIYGMALAVGGTVSEGISGEFTVSEQSNALQSIILTLDLKLLSNGSEMQPLTPIDIELTLPLALRNASFIIQHTNAAGKVETIPYEVLGAGVIRFRVTGCSIYAFVEQERSDPVIPVFIPQKPKDGWIQNRDGTQSYRNSSGKLLTGWQKLEAAWYFFDANGKMQSQYWNLSDGKWYYLQASGVMAANQWLLDNGKWYYLKASGAMAANQWLLDDGKWYYLKASGAMVANQWLLDDGKWYYLTETGAMAVNTTTPDGYRVNELGVWVS